MTFLAISGVEKCDVIAYTCEWKNVKGAVGGRHDDTICPAAAAAQCPE